MIAFKEWSLICQSLAHGRQSLILRKGGIAEGRGGFQWKYDRFALFPTHFHEQAQHLKTPPSAPLPQPDLTQHTIDLMVTLDWKCELGDWEQVLSLSPYHDWTDETIHERFGYEGEHGISVALVRVWRLPQPVTFPDERGYGGCRSWVEIPLEADESTLTPVLTDAEHAARLDTIRHLLH